jgi:hypothetical protein
LYFTLSHTIKYNSQGSIKPSQTYAIKELQIITWHKTSKIPTCRPPSLPHQ